MDATPYTLFFSIFYICLFFYLFVLCLLFFFFFNNPPPPKFSPFPLPAPLPIGSRGVQRAWLQPRRYAVAVDSLGREYRGESQQEAAEQHELGGTGHGAALEVQPQRGDRKSTRLNSSHLVISYAVFCLKKKKIRR